MKGALLSSRSESKRRVAAARRDDTAFSALVATYQADVLRVCYVILGDRALAEDAAQSAWVQTWRKLDTLRDSRKLRAWLLAVAANEARQIARRRRAFHHASATEPYGADADPRLFDLTTALAKLAPDDRRLLGLRYVAELTSDEIGVALGISASAVRHRLMRLLGRLRADLEEVES
jgi:RNA polymerase sigma-70 factor (ECF subfamily)